MSEMVAVKPLVWPKECRRGRRVTGRGLLSYSIAHYGGDVGPAIYRWAAPLGSWSEPFQSYDDAKSGANQHYAGQVLASLSPRSEGDEG